MAHPWLFEAKADANSATPFGFDSESDTGSRLDAPHFSDLARFPGSELAPYRGAYCWRVEMGDTNDHTLTEGDIDIADGATAFLSFYLYLAPNVAATADDTFNLFEFQQAAGTREASLGLRITAATQAVEIGVGDGIAPTDFATSPLERNCWYHVEVKMKCSTGAAGTLTLYLDGLSVVALTGLTNAAAVGQGVLGTQDTLATTTGTLLLDWLRFDDAQIYPQRERFPLQTTFTQSCHAFVGPGTIGSFTLLSTTAGNIARLYDTDTGNVNNAQGFVAECDLSAFVSVEGPLEFRRGCFVQLTGTNPRAQVTLGDEDGDHRPPFYSAWGMRHYGRGRKERPNNV